MNWLSDLLRQVTVSRSLTAAAFATSAALLLGPKVLPSVVEPVPKEWQFLPAAVLVFSGCFLLLWLGTAAWRGLRHTYWSVVYSIRGRKIEDNELEVLQTLAARPDTPMNVRTVNYETSPLSELQMSLVMDALASKGLIRFGPHERVIIFLTARGKRIAVQSMRRRNEGAT
jgi:hypothetical protein